MKSRSCALAMLWIGSLVLGGSAEAATRLQPGVPLSGEIKARAAQTYEWVATPGRWRIAVDQQGADVVVAVQAADGAVLAKVDSPSGSWGPEIVLVDLPAAGLYRIELQPLLPAGRYDIRIDDTASLPAPDQARLPAEEAMSAAAGLLALDAPEGLRAATAEYEKALAAWRALESPGDEARTSYCLGELARQQGDLAAARPRFQEALALWRQTGDRARESLALNALGLNHWQTGDGRAARPFFEQALEIDRALGDPLAAALSLNNVCLTDQATDDLPAALDCYRQVLDQLRPLGADLLQASVLHNLGNLQDSLGEPEPAFASYRQALELRRRNSDRTGEAATLNSLAVLHRRLGEPGEALALYHQALALQRDLHDPREEAAALNNIGYAYYSLGDLDRALAYLQDGLSRRRETGDRRGEAVTLSNLGLVRRDLGEPRQALELFQQGLELRRQVGDRAGESTLLRLIAETWTALGDLGQAAASLDRAFGLVRPDDENRRPGLLEARASVALQRGDTAAALADQRAALDAYRRLRSLSSQAQALEQLAQIERRAGDPASARRHAGEALNLIETLRTRVTSPELRSAFLASRRRTFELAIDLLMAEHAVDPGRGRDREALALSERAHARTLVELLGESPAGIRQGVDPELLEREQALRRRLQAKTDRQLRLLQGNPTAEQAAAAELERYQAQADLDQLEAEIRRHSPADAKRTRPETLGADEIQRLLDPGTVLLEYSLGAERSFLWAVTPVGVESFELPPRAEIEARVRQVREQMVTLQAGTAAARRSEAAELVRTLIGPLTGRLGEQRLVVVADGALHYIPFAALPSPDGDGLLILHHEIVSLPSASALAEARRQAGRPRPTRQLAIFADPVFEATDPRLQPAAARPAKEPAMATRSGQLDGGKLERLTATRKEADAIAALLPADQVLKALDFAARRSTLLDGELRPYRVVHLATHGRVDSRHPELSGIVLSRFDEKGKPLDGELRLQDLYNLDLGAELVVLSGCSTALGREVRGEGLVGITRGFLYAGVPRVIASLWQVQDRATAELMTQFYRALILDGQTPAAALRTAQLAVLRQPRWRSPYYWAAFVHQGDWQ